MKYILPILICIFLLISSCKTSGGGGGDADEIISSADVEELSLSYGIITDGTYTCASCTEPQDWYIDENHIMFWDDKPYIPNFINDYLWNHDLTEMDHIRNPDASIEDLKRDIDTAMQKGITEFIIEVSSLGYTADDAERADQRIKAAVEHINSVGGTYILKYSIQPVFFDILKQHDTEKYEEYLRTLEEDGHVDTLINVKDMLKEDMLKAIRDDMRRVATVGTSPALRAIDLFGEINGEEAITGTDEELHDNIETVFNEYGKMAKQEIGDVPVLFVGNTEHMRPYLMGLRARNFDGIIIQLPGSMPEQVHTLAQRYPLGLRILNSCQQTKLYWSYSQVCLSYSCVLFRSKELMQNQYQALIEGGVTGFSYDQFSSFGFTLLGLPEDSPELRLQNHQWWGELKPVFEEEILRRAKTSEFTAGKWATFITEEELLPANKLDEEQVKTIARNHPDVKQLLDMGAHIDYVQFFGDLYIWMVGVTGERGEIAMNWEFWIDDSDGKIIINRVKLVEDMRQAGYPLPSDEELLALSRNDEDS